MKTIITIWVLFLSGLILAQTPQMFKYQAVVRDGAGNLITNTNVSFRISIVNGSGTSIYTETHSAMTNDRGLVNLEVGGGTIVSGSFSSIDWGAGSLSMEVELDPAGGSSYTSLGTSSLLSVPYALYAANSQNDSVIDADADPTNEFQMLSMHGDTIMLSNGGFVILPSNPGGNSLDAAYDQGGPGFGRTITADSGAVRINGTGHTALEIDPDVGHNGIEILNTTAIGKAGLLATASISGTGVAVSNSGMGNGVSVQNTGAGNGILVDHDGTGSGIRVESASGGSAIRMLNDGTGVGMEISNLATAKQSLLVVHDGDSSAVKLRSIGDGGALQILNDGDGIGIDLEQVGDSTGLNIGNHGSGDAVKIASGPFSEDALEIMFDGNGNAINLLHGSGFGINVDNAGFSTAVNFGNFNPANTAPALFGKHMGLGSVARFETEDNDLNFTETMFVRNSASGKAAVFVTEDNLSGKVNTDPTVEVVNNGLGVALNIQTINASISDVNDEPSLYAEHKGFGGVGFFRASDPLNTETTVDIENLGLGHALHISSSSGGLASSALSVEVSADAAAAHFDSQIPSTLSSETVLISTNATSPAHAALRVTTPGITDKAAVLGGEVDILGDLTVSTDLSVPSATIASLFVTTSIVAPVKAFRIDHPLDPDNMYLYHNSVESNERVNIYSGNITTNQEGLAVVELPDYMTALNADFRYQLTVIGKSFARAVVWEEIDLETQTFTIRTDEPNITVSWQVVGERIDTWSEENPLIVEVAK